jgi:hypothetical protein
MGAGKAETNRMIGPTHTHRRDLDAFAMRLRQTTSESAAVSGLGQTSVLVWVVCVAGIAAALAVGVVLLVVGFEHDRIADEITGGATLVVGPTLVWLGCAATIIPVRTNNTLTQLHQLTLSTIDREATEAPGIPLRYPERRSSATRTLN